ncbi:Alpha/Beta hydrolase protein [Thermothelomyces heterothallicus CBS 202.75]|uniref:Alpha/Beta hydrolase protein n=1 Tax=Thermothelomyces heterothallicus CBS 202.75 TaxID=1149848 RepID=UPI003742F29F
MPPTRIPTKEDFASILPSHPTYQGRRRQQQQQQQQQEQQQRQGKGGGQPDDDPISLVYPNPPESTTSILLLFHGLGDTEAAFAAFARNLALPGVLAIAVRGTAPLPPALLPPPPPSPADDGGGGARAGYHWGDDLVFSRDGDAIDPDPGFDRARAWVVDRLIGEVLVRRCGWAAGDLMLFGFGQGASFALGLASALRGGDRVVEVVATKGAAAAGQGKGDGNGNGNWNGNGMAFKGVVAIGGALPVSMVPTVGGLGKSKTPVLVCCGRESEAVDEDAVELLEREFKDVKVVRWKRNDDGMPRNREEALPMMRFFAERLRNLWL